MLLLWFFSLGEMRSYACYPSSELVGEGISVLLGCTRDLSYGLASVAVRARCLSAIVGMCGCCGSGLSQQWVQQIHHSWEATSVDQRAWQLPVPLCLFSLGVLLAVGSKKHRMFAVLLWALRVPSTSAAARFSSILLLVGVLPFREMSITKRSILCGFECHALEPWGSV